MIIYIYVLITVVSIFKKAISLTRNPMSIRMTMTWSGLLGLFLKLQRWKPQLFAHDKRYYVK